MQTEFKIINTVGCCKTPVSVLHLQTKGNHGIRDRKGEVSIHVYGEAVLSAARVRGAVRHPPCSPRPRLCQGAGHRAAQRHQGCVTWPRTLSYPRALHTVWSHRKTLSCPLASSLSRTSHSMLLDRLQNGRDEVLFHSRKAQSGQRARGSQQAAGFGREANQAEPHGDGQQRQQQLQPWLPWMQQRECRGGPQ